MCSGRTVEMPGTSVGCKRDKEIAPLRKGAISFGVW